uniref:Uncharacterized protein n=1 Tax=Rhizophora mucronata TaxID=61149 RepID=A0A2P2JRU1_RHIMU
MGLQFLKLPIFSRCCPTSSSFTLSKSSLGLSVRWVTPEIRCCISRGFAAAKATKIQLPKRRAS